MNYIFAIGDIHGRLDLLRLAAKAIDTYLSDRAARGVAIFLGDYVDRGPDSRGVIEFLMNAQRNAPLLCLKGNHEEMMLEALTSGDCSRWIASGGAATLSSYGGEDIPPEHIAWLSSLPTIAELGNRIFVHAGLMPGVPLKDQKDEWRMWIRERFLLAGNEFIDWPHIVHGHTPIYHLKPNPAEPELLPWRTNLDTGAFHTGVLTVGVFTDAKPGPIELLRVTADANKPLPPRSFWGSLPNLWKRRTKTAPQ